MKMIVKNYWGIILRDVKHGARVGLASPDLDFTRRFCCIYPRRSDVRAAFNEIPIEMRGDYMIKKVDISW